MGLARALGLWGLLESSAHFPAVSSSQGERQLLLLAAQFPGQPFPHRVVIDNTIGCATGCGGPVGWGCYSLHILKRGVPAGCFPGFCTQDCYSAHIFSLPMRPYLSQYRRFFVSISSCIFCTFLRFTAAFPAYPPQQTKKMLGCYPQHNSMYSVFSFGFQIAYPPTAQANTTWPAKILSASPSKKTSHPPRCYPAHISGSGVVIGRTVSKL